MAHLRQKFKWIDEFEGKSLTFPITPNSYIGIIFDAVQVSACRHCVRPAERLIAFLAEWRQAEGAQSISNNGAVC